MTRASTTLFAGLGLALSLAATAIAQNAPTFMAGKLKIEQPWSRATPRGAPVAGARWTSISIVSSNGYDVRTSMRNGPPAVWHSTMHGPQATAASPSSAVAIHIERTSFGQPWWRFAVQQPKLGSSPKIVQSSPACVQSRHCTVHRTWFACWWYWCALTSAVIVAGRRL